LWQPNHIADLGLLEDLRCFPLAVPPTPAAPRSLRRGFYVEKVYAILAKKRRIPMGRRMMVAVFFLVRVAWAQSSGNGIDQLRAQWIQDWNAKQLEALITLSSLSSGQDFRFSP
jgi:hypothetical protein